MDVNELIEILYPGILLEEKKERILELLQGHIDWNKRHKTHDWKNYVPELIRDTWVEFTTNEQLVVYFFAEKQAEDEDWD